MCAVIAEKPYAFRALHLAREVIGAGVKPAFSYRLAGC